MAVATGFLVMMFLGYNYVVFELIDAFLENPRLKKLYRIPVGIINTLLAVVVSRVFVSTSLVAYILIGTILFLDFALFYKDELLRSLFCALACVVHVMVMRSICVASFALATGKTFYEVAADPFLRVCSLGVCFFLLNVAVLTVLRMVPARGVKIINQHRELLWFMVTWLSVFCIYLLINSRVYSTQNIHPSLLVNQIAAPCAILLGTYIVLFFSMKTSTLLGYKEKNEELQQTVEKERQYRSTIDKGVVRVIEVNFSKDAIISGFEEDEAALLKEAHSYQEVMGRVIESTVHPDDRVQLIHHISPQTAVEEYSQGRREIAFDYREQMPDGHYVWMRALIPLMQDEKTGDIRGFVQIKNIDPEKKQQLELQYKAERDLLTGLYNKTTTETLISQCLNDKENSAFSGVLFVIDIDNFKTINDHLGHLYGDAVLSELSESLEKIFREDDIVGRIGGDEFLVLAKGTLGQRMIEKKAGQICHAFLRTYSNEKNEGYGVSGSIGISIFPKDGASFQELFQSADTALYATKACGKNGYSFYQRGAEMPYASTRTEIDTHGIRQKSFRDNRIEYVFRLLYGSEDTEGAIESVLELIAKNFDFSRANIFEFNEISTHFNCVFEWCADGIDSVRENYVDMPLESFEFVIAALERSGGMFLAIPTDFPTYAQEHYTSIGIRTIVHLSIKERDRLLGVIAFQNCTDENPKTSETELEELRTICQVLSVFMAQQLGSEREQRHHAALETVMDNMNSIAYVVDRETFEVFYENQNTVDVTGHSSVGNKCHIAYRGLDSPCPDCALNYLSAENPQCTLELYTEKFDLFTKTSGSLINWPNGREALLISSVDITEYKRQRDQQSPGHTE